MNLGSVCSHCLYNGAVSWSSIVGGRMRILTLLLGVAGVGIALAGVWSHFLSWLVILSVFVPPIGAVLIADQVLLRGASESRLVGAVRPTAFAAWAVGAGFAALVHYEAPQWSDAVVGLVTGAVAYLAIEAVAAQSRVTVARRVPDAVGAE